jgi:hypothetical protein
MTPFEKAQIKLRAWEALAGWGVKKGDDKFPEPWNWDQRLKHAEQLADWACEQPQVSAESNND